MTSWKIGGETMETVTDFIFLGTKVTASCDCCHKCKSSFLLGRKAMINLDSILKSRDITLLTKIHVWMWEMDHKEGWVLKNWCLQTVVMVKILESPLDSKEIKPVNLKRNQPFQSIIGRIDAEAETPILWLCDVKNWLIGKDPDVGKSLRAWKEGADRGWDGWLASLTQRTWVWANSLRYWRTGKPGVLQSMASKRVGCDLVSEQQQLVY